MKSSISAQLTALFLLLPLGLIQTCLAVTQTVHDASWQPTYVLVATEEDIMQDCQVRRSVVFNGTSPGPPLYLQEGQTTWVRAYNDMPDKNLTIHWHGLTMRTSPFSDGTPQVAQWPIAPGEFFDYEIHPEEGDAGTYWYHSHVGFSAVTGHGPLFVQDCGEPPYQYDDDLPFIVGEHYNKTDSEIESAIMGTPFKWPGAPSALIFNSQSGSQTEDSALDDSCKPHVLSVEPEKTYRARFVTTCPLAYTIIEIEGHTDLSIIEADGRYTKEVHTDHIQFGSGERYSALLKTKTLDELEEDGKDGRYTITYKTPDGPSGYLSGTAILQYDMSSNSTSTKRWSRAMRRALLGKGHHGGSSRSDRDDSAGHGDGEGSTAPAHDSLPGKPDMAIDNSMTQWMEYTLEPLEPKAAFPTLAEVTRTLYINVTTDSQKGGSLVFEFNDLTWNDVTYGQVPGNVPYLIDAYVNQKTPDPAAIQTSNGWDPSTRAFPAEVGEVIDIVWQQTNLHPDESSDYHPMHAHGEHYWDLGSGTGAYDAEANEANFADYTPMTRDTTMLYSYAGDSGEATSAWRAWRMRITEDNIGAWLMHCHILQHMLMGMQTAWVFGNATEILENIPEPYVSGYLEYGGSAYGNASYDPLVTSWYD